MQDKTGHTPRPGGEEKHRDSLVRNAARGLGRAFACAGFSCNRQNAIRRLLIPDHMGCTISTVRTVNQTRNVAPSPFQLVGGHPALDFVNTLDWRFRPSWPEELINTYNDLLRF